MKYQDLFDSISEAIYIHKEDGVFIDVNEGAAIMYGCDREDLIGMNPEMISAPGKNNLHEVFDLMRDAMLTGKPRQTEFWGVRKNGEIFPKDVIFTRGIYQGEKVIITTARDITEQRKIEQALRESETKYRILAEKMHDVVWILNLDLQITYVSPSTEYTLGYTPSERMALRIDECMVPESLDYAMQIMINEAVISQDERSDKDRSTLLELEYYHKDGSTRWLEQSINGIYDENGNLTAIMGVARDVTERRKAQDSTRRAALEIALKNEVNELLLKLGKPKKYIIS